MCTRFGCRTLLLIASLEADQLPLEEKGQLVTCAKFCPVKLHPSIVWISHCRLYAKTDRTCDSKRRRRGLSCRIAVPGMWLRYVAGQCFAFSPCLAYCVTRRCPFMSACVCGSKTTASSSAFTSIPLDCACYTRTIGDGEVKHCDSV